MQTFTSPSVHLYDLEKVVGLTGFVIIHVFIASFSPAQGERNQMVNTKFTRPVNEMPMSTPIPLPYRSTFGVACPPPSYPFKQHFLLPCLTACVVHSHKGAPLLLQLLSRLHINIVPEAENGPRPVGFSEVLSPPLESCAGLEMEL